MKKWLDKIKKQHIVFLLFLLSVFFASYFLTNWINSSKSQKFSQINPVEYISNLHVVSYYYDAYVPVGKNKNKLDVLYNIPARVDGYIDFNDLEIAYKDRKIVEVGLPAGRISEPYLDYAQGEEIFRDKKWFSIAFNQAKKNNKRFESFTEYIKKTKENIKDAAKAQMIQRQIDIASKILLGSIYKKLGYETEFVPINSSKGIKGFINKWLKKVQANEMKDFDSDKQWEIIRELINVK